MSDFTLDVGLAAKIKQALARNGITSTAVLDWLASGDNVARVREVQLGHADITYPEHTIDLEPSHSLYSAQQMWITETTGGGKFRWNPEQVRLYQSKDQSRKGGMTLAALRCEIFNTRGLGEFSVSALDYLLEHQVLIPEEARGTIVLCTGTVFSEMRLNLECICSMHYDCDKWVRGWHRTSESFDRRFAVLTRVF